MEPSFQLAAILLLSGLFILILELFIPSAGILFFLSATCIVGSIIVAFLTDRTLGFVFLFGVILLTPVVGWGAFQVWKRSPVGKRMFLEVSAVEAERDDPSEPSYRDPANYRSLLDRIGTTVTPLRPVGITDFSGRRVDTVAEGVMIDRGELVRVVEVQGSRVVVRKLEPAERESLASKEPFEI